MKMLISLTLFLCVTCFLTSAMAADTLKAGDIDPKSGKKIKYWVAPMDPTYIRQEPGKSPMGMDLVPVFAEEGGEKLPASTIRIDPVTSQNMGVRTATVKRQKLTKDIRALGYVSYDETKIYAINLKFDGWIEKLYVNFEGEQVAKGQKMFDIYSPALVTAQEEYLLAQKQFDALEKSSYSSIRDGAKRLLEASLQRLRYWDISERQIEMVKKRGTVQKELSVYSPQNGVVIKKTALVGHYAKAGQHLYDIADLSTVWVEVEVYEYELPFIKKGMQVEMELSYLPGKRFPGQVLFIYPYLNKKTRTAKLRLSFDNSQGNLKPDMYANVYLQSTIDDHAVVVPQEAVINSGQKSMVFLAQGNGKFEPRTVKLGIEGNDDTYQVLEGLQEGDKVVVSAQFLLDSESRLQEAIQKMMEVRTGSTSGADDSLDMSGLKMDDTDIENEMSDMNME